MFYAFNKNKNLYLYGSDKREITEKSLNDNVKTDIDEWNVIELNEDVVTVNGKQFLRSSVPTAERIAEKAKKCVLSGTDCWLNPIGRKRPIARFRLKRKKYGQTIGNR